MGVLKKIHTALGELLAAIQRATKLLNQWCDDLDEPKEAVNRLHANGAPTGRVSTKAR